MFILGCFERCQWKLATLLMAFNHLALAERVYPLCGQKAYIAELVMLECAERKTVTNPDVFHSEFTVDLVAKAIALETVELSYGSIVMETQTAHQGLERLYVYEGRDGLRCSDLPMEVSTLMMADFQHCTGDISDDTLCLLGGHRLKQLPERLSFVNQR